MFGSIKKRALAALQSGTSDTACPNCHCVFNPSSGPELTAWSDLLKKTACPKCGHTFTVAEGDEAKVNPPGPFGKPVTSRIEMVAGSGALVFCIPRGYHPLGLDFTAVIMWNLIAWTIFIIVLMSGTDALHCLLPAVCPAIGVGLLYGVLRQTFITYQLTLGPQNVQFRRKLIFHKDREVFVSEITSVRKKSWYKNHHEPVYGIKITAGLRRIRFGTEFSDDEKNWLCWHIREFARQHGAPLED